ncbi:helix-turn-helix domain-containing protein [Porticoccus sp. W117]|uniref:helix-turn-helix domain-containing protein n=1 Tax=Porticoccus sp. W117 TaxID=3054777 RepID=UPI0025928D0C|nr:helix-turn-helix domain-containing protein [Porticoccus sp. W117]MDM3870128.1 helix-turn-helix domain-containing protein [Porticoccus sp. W117]
MQDNNKDQSSDREEAKQSWQTPGIALRQGRRAQNLTEDEVCRELGLRIGVLKALESDDFERLPTDVYVRGYIRSYCHLLGMEEQPVLESYEAYCQQLPGSHGKPATEGQVTKQQPWWQQPKSWLIAGVVFLVAVVLAVLL